MANDPKVKVTAPQSVVSSGTVNVPAWTKLLTEIRGIDLAKDTTATRTFVTALKSNPDAPKPATSIPADKLERLTDKATAEAELQVRQHKNDLLSMNTEGRHLMNRLVQDGKQIEAVNKLLRSEIDALKSGGGSDAQKARAKRLGEAVSNIKQIAKTHNDLLHIPMLSHNAVSRCVTALKKTA